MKPPQEKYKGLAHHLLPYNSNPCFLKKEKSVDFLLLLISTGEWAGYDMNYKKLIKNKFWLKVRGRELWFSPEGTEEMFFLTNKKITWKEIEKIKGQKLFS